MTDATAVLFVSPWLCPTGWRPVVHPSASKFTKSGCKSQSAAIAAARSNFDEDWEMGEGWNGRTLPRWCAWEYADYCQIRPDLHLASLLFDSIWPLPLNRAHRRNRQREPIY
jgi:hypothetical protein